MTVHRQHVDAVARSQVEVAHRAVAVAGVAAHNGLGQHHIAGRDGLEAVGAVDRQQPVVTQLDKIAHTGMQHQPVAGQQPGVVERRRQLVVAAEDFQHADTAVAVQVGLADGLADDRRVVRHQQLGHKGARLVRAQLARQAFAVRQQAMTDQQHKGHAYAGQHQAGQGDLEHAERLHAHLPGYAVDQNVGRGADHGHGAAKDGGVGQRDQHLRGLAADAGGQGNGNRREDGDHRRVVDEGRQQQRRHHQAEQGAPLAAAAHARQPVAEGLDAAGALQRGGENEHAGDGDRGAVGQHAEDFGWGQQLTDQQHGNRDAHDHVRAEFFPREGVEHPAQQQCYAYQGQ